MILRLNLLVCGDAPKRVLRLRVDIELLFPMPQLTWTLMFCLGELGILMTALGQTETHVAEIFGPGRFTVRARRFDLRPGTAMDLRTGYDFNKEADRLRARECQTNELPLLLVGSPRCAAFSQLQNLAKDSERWRACQVLRTWLTPTPNLQTDVRLQSCRMSKGVARIPKQFRDAV